MGGSGLYLRIGLLIVGGVVLLVGLIWFLGGAQLSHGILFETYFSESVQGLEVGAPVKYRGVTLGRVTEIGLVTAEYGRNESVNLDLETYQLVFVRSIIDADKLGRVPGTEEAVNSGLRARLASQGLTGLTYIELDFVDPKEYPPLAVPWTPKAPYIPSMPSTLLKIQDAAQQLLSNLNHVDLNKLATEFTGLAADLRANLASGEVHHVLADADAAVRAAQDAIRDADLPGLSAAVKQTAGSLRDTLQNPDTQKLLANAALAAERFAIAAERLPPLLASIQSTSRRADNSVADVQQSLVPVLRDIQATAANLRELTAALRGAPAQTIFGSPPPHATEPLR
jgi:ABC-type transporter Mla subunit MlaD